MDFSDGLYENAYLLATNRRHFIENLSIISHGDSMNLITIPYNGGKLVGSFEDIPIGTEQVYIHQISYNPLTGNERDSLIGRMSESDLMPSIADEFSLEQINVFTSNISKALALDLPSAEESMEFLSERYGVLFYARHYAHLLNEIKEAQMKKISNSKV